MATTTKTVLKMVFKGTNALGEESSRTLSLDNPRSDIAEADITSFMSLCITKKALFLSGTEIPVTGIKEAYKEETVTTPIVSAAPASEPSVVAETTKSL